MVALLASAGGLFSVLNAAVARRRREFGIRVALGIEPARLTRLVLADAARLAALGLVFGVAGAWVLGRALASLTYGVSPADPLVDGGCRASRRRFCSQPGDLRDTLRAYRRRSC